MYEQRHKPLISRGAFRRRILVHMGAATGIMAGSLLLGVLGYHLLEDLDWVDALLNASMLMGGMGPVHELHTGAGKIFASMYALYAGLVVLIVAGVLFAPVFHRFLHRFHLDTDEPQSRTKKADPH